MITNEVHKLSSAMKLSKYNMIVKDKDDNLVIYNYLTGIPSLTKILKPDVDTFSKLFLENAEIKDSDCEGYEILAKKLLESGILVDKDLNESILYVAKSYEEIYDSKLHLAILTTGKCNFNCSYCFEAEQPLFRERMLKERQDAIIKFVQKNINKFNGLDIAWFGGEPLLEPLTISEMSEKMIKICKARCIPYSSRITTNGYFLDGDTFDTLYKNKVYDYMITVDGFKKQHDRFRHLHNGAGTYDIIMKNLIGIRDNKQYKFAKITIRINVSRDVLDIIDELIQYLDSTFSDDSRFSFLFIPVENYSKTKVDDGIFVDIREVYDRLNSNVLFKDKFVPQNAEMGMLLPVNRCVSSNKNKFVIRCAHYKV